METEQARGQPILQMRGITKRFPGVLALDNVDFDVRGGEIHSLIGQNGAGKSTLMKILVGDYLPSDGEIRIGGQPVVFRHPRAARAMGIAIVYQELSLLPNLTVAENIFLGREPGPFLVIDDDAIRRESRRILEQLGIDHVDIEQKVGTLSLAQQQLVEIAKALSFQPRIFILDEPTAALTPQDATRLFKILMRLKEQGIAIVYISHRLREIIEYCDRGTILRNGRVVATVDIAGETTEETLIELMIGQEINSFYRKRRLPYRVEASDPLLQVENLSVGEKVTNVSFTLRRGEIVGITGLLGAGQNELARALFGIQPGVSGVLRRDGEPVTISSPRAAIALGICLLTEDRKEEGLILQMSVKENITLPSLHKFLRTATLPLLANSREREAAQTFIEKVNIVLRSAAAQMRTLSGGNQQKAIIARWLLRDLDVLIFIEPTRGIDIGAKAEIYRYLDALADEGRGIIVVSPELREVLGISDRILVMHEGQLVHEFAAAEATEEALLAAIQGAALSLQAESDGNGYHDIETTTITRTAS